MQSLSLTLSNARKNGSDVSTENPEVLVGSGVDYLRANDGLSSVDRNQILGICSASGNKTFLFSILTYLLAPGFENVKISDSNKQCSLELPRLTL